MTADALTLSWMVALGTAFTLWVEPHLRRFRGAAPPTH